jgi:P27 family predicted phage terminase small subunit
MGGPGSGGHNRKSIAEKKAQGNPGRRKLRVRKPNAEVGEPPIPEFLTEAGRKVWPQVCAVLAGAGALYKSHGFAVAGLCSNIVMFRQAEEALARYGLINVELCDKDAGFTVLKTNPAVRIRKSTLAEMRKDWQAFGLDPRSMDATLRNLAQEAPKEGLLEKLMRIDEDEIVT